MRTLSPSIHYPRCLLNRFFRLQSLLQRRNGRVHLGCGRVRLPDCVNIDAFPGPATDVIADCTRMALFRDRTLSRVYGNAFLEHLHPEERQSLLSDTYRALRDDGLLLFTGIPDIEAAARAYLERRSPGNLRAVFDAEELWRYTHGELGWGSGFRLEDLHKSPLDAGVLCDLLDQAGFAVGLVFRYCWGTEPVAVSMACVAAKSGYRPTGSIEELPWPREANIHWPSLEVTATLRWP